MRCGAVQGFSNGLYLLHLSTLYLTYLLAHFFVVRLYDKRDDFNFSIIKFPCFLRSNVPSTPACSVYVYQWSPMIQPVANIEALVDKRKLLTGKVLSLGYTVD